MMSIKDRYNGIQTVFKALGDEGCHFLVLCSIAEEHTGRPVDLINLIRVCQSRKWIEDDFWVKNDGTPILEYLTGEKWERKEVERLPIIGDNDYTEAIYFNPRTELRHYRRRYVDTLAYSTTVAEGYIIKYYIYTAMGRLS